MLVLRSLAGFRFASALFLLCTLTASLATQVTLDSSSYTSVGYLESFYPWTGSAQPNPSSFALYDAMEVGFFFYDLDCFPYYTSLNIKIDLSSLPGSADITAAELYVPLQEYYSVAPSSLPFQLKLLSNNWTPSTSWTTFKNSVTVTSPPLDTDTVTGTTNGAVFSSADLVDAVQAALSSGVISLQLKVSNSPYCNPAVEPPSYGPNLMAYNKIGNVDNEIELRLTYN